MTRRKHFIELIEFQLTELTKIRYVDQDVQHLRNQADLADDHLIDSTCWTGDGLLAVAVCCPVILRRSTRSAGMYEVIANGALLPALRQKHPEISEVPAFICSHVSSHDKRLLAGSELLGLSALFRHREKQVEAMAAMWMGPLLGEPLRSSDLAGLRATCCPPVGRLIDAQRRSRDDFFERATHVWRSDRALAGQGVRLHLQNTDQGMNDVVFTDASSLQTYLAFLDACSVAPAAVKICLRRASETEGELPEWAKGRLGSFGACAVHVIRPRSTDSVDGYRMWLGLKILDEQGRGAGVWLSRAWFYSAVAARAGAT